MADRERLELDLRGTDASDSSSDRNISVERPCRAWLGNKFFIWRNSREALGSQPGRDVHGAGRLAQTKYQA